MSTATIAPVNPMAAEGKDTVLTVMRRDREKFTRMVSDPKNWNVQTRCTGWETRDLVGHMIDVMGGYFKSIYYREPGGVLFEIATDTPGFTIDEKPESLGSSLSLPPWFQVRRDHLDDVLTPIVVPTNLIQGRVSN